MHRRLIGRRESKRPGGLGCAWLLALAVVLTGAAWTGPARAAENALIRFPALHGNEIVFESGGNLWKVSRQGGVAQRLTTDRGNDLMPRFSPDGKFIAFTGQYDGNTDVYVMPAQGGTPKRLTFHSDVVEDAPMRWGPDNMVVTWTPDGKGIVFLSRRDTFNSWFGRLFVVPVEGGLPVRLPVDTAGLATYSPDGSKLAMNRIFRNFRTWKRYYGGLAQDVWIYDLTSHACERVTDWKGTDTFPMWAGDTIYFASDRGPEGRLNLWAYDLKTKAFRQVTHFTGYDMDWPSLGDTGIVFQEAGALCVMDLPSEQIHTLDVTVPSDGVRTRPRWVDASKTIMSFGIAPNGKRALFGARGEVFTVPEEHGNTRDLTQTSGAREMYPAWSPDGKWVAYVTDRTGEAEMAVRPAGGEGEESLLTERTKGYLYGPTWSPDGARLAYSDSDHVLWVLDVASRRAVKVGQDRREEMHHVSWSPDGLWLAYTKAGSQDMGSDDDASTYMGRIYFYNVKEAKSYAVSMGQTDDSEPVFSPDGKYLYFISARHENPVFSQTEFNVASLKMDGIYAATLQAGEASPFAPRSDEGAVKSAEEPKAAPWKPGVIPAIRIDMQGLAQRVVPLPIPAGNIRHLRAASGRVYYMTVPLKSFETALPGEEPALHVFDMAKRKDAVLVSPLKDYALSADGSTVLTQDKEDYTTASALPADDQKAGGEAKSHKLDLTHMKALVDPVAEWKEMFGEAWRLERDFFFSRETNGVNWDKVRIQYEPFLPLLACREDLNYVTGEMIGELHNSHTYVGGGDDFKNPYVPTGLMGADLALDTTSGLYTFAKIYAGDNSKASLRSPLTEPGVNVNAGDVLLAVNGHALKAPANPYSLFAGTLGQTVTLTVAGDAAGKGRREVTVKPVPEELELRLKDWVDHNRAEVSRLSGGKIGYLYLTDMDETGMKEFIRQFYWQTPKEGLIIDDRWNGGGEIDQILLERLRRVLVGMDTNREGARFTIPAQVMHGTMACLINHYSASDGDIFPYYFRKYGLGPVIGTRTWGGVRGIRGFWPLCDGGYVTIPEDALYGLHSQWVIENHGVDPDVEVDDLPGDVLAGKDAQLEKAVEVLMEKIHAKPMTLPAPPPPLPAYPQEGQ